MDSDLVLNIAESDPLSNRSSKPRKGGRRRERVKSKRVAKRKTPHPEGRPRDKQPATEQGISQRPAKRARQDNEEHSQEKISPSTRPRHVISSLFTSNPKVEPIVSAHVSSQKPLRPSNAPLADSSTFAGLGLDPLLVQHLTKKMNIAKPTAIQRSALPALLSEEHTSRDVFIQSQTGSGKTLSFLLPILQDLLPLSSHSYIDRSIGTLAIIIAPTRELAKQISDVLEALLKLRLRSEDESPDDENASSQRMTRWLVSGLLIGGATRTHEKARLRKGIPILVATPGRLLDHLQNTSSFNVGKCRWLVLDEADRLMDLGFEETINGILQGLDGRRKLALQAVQAGKSMEVGGWDWERRRRTILCSATIHEGVQKLAGTTLSNPIMIKATEVDKLEPLGPPNSEETEGATKAQDEHKFTPPSQLTQKYVVVPLKLRLVVLVALLRSLLAQKRGNRGTKIIVFLSCTDSVDFHWKLLGTTSMDEDEEGDEGDAAEEDELESEKIEMKCALLPNTSIFRLHGSLQTQTRLASLQAFVNPSKNGPVHSSVLLCTSVASRGLDLPLVQAVIQYDLPTEGGATEYVHRVGRTARAGKGGEAWSLVAPSEADWVKWIGNGMQRHSTDPEAGSQSPISLIGIPVEEVLRGGFRGDGKEYEERATEVQLAFERWVLRSKTHADLARKAYLSHTRAYATHPASEKHIFHIRKLHLGHLAKSFALRETPTAATTKQSGKKKTQTPFKGGQSRDQNDATNAEARMQQVVRDQGRLTKRQGMMMSSGTSEFQIAGGDELEKLVGKYH
ncbi:hypothetical protein AX16_010683 [Volvariella volvacea WC 439]|nr:hypothetical protein AX16_010683 [Volvariella volvacea WC 439]